MPPGRQRTFDLVPTTLVKSNGQKPPMTSKAAKKAYQQANRGPRISRAEQRRLDVEELDRQRKEYEREKASVRARAAREKKAEKASAERNERKKLGIPEPSRFVRASQPTISRFVNSNGKRVWQEMDSIAEDSEGTACGGDDQDEVKPPAKQVVLDGGEQNEAHLLAIVLATHETQHHNAQLPGKVLAVEDESEDDFGDFPSLSQSDLLEKIDSSLMSIKGISPRPIFPLTGPVNDSILPNDVVSQKLPVRRFSQEEFPFDSQALADMANTQLLLEAAEAASNSANVESMIQPSPIPQNSTLSAAPRSVNQSQQWALSDDCSEMVHQKPAILPRPALQNQSINMPPLPLIFSKGKSNSFIPIPVRARFAPRNTATTFLRLPANQPPPSTQAFLENNLDDFLPSPSQELLELLSDADDLPSNAQIATELSSMKSKMVLQVALQHEEPSFDDFICTQDFILSSQDLREISPVKENPNPKPTPQISTLFVSGVIDDFPSTQDLRLSPQALEEIETPSLAPSKTANNLLEEVRKLLKENSGENACLKETPKDKDILTGKLKQRSSQASKEQPRQPLTEQMTDKSRANPKQRRRFFEEKDDDLLRAAIQESKITAQKEVKRGLSKDDGKKVPLKEENRRETRPFQRVRSAATDYGDDEFEGFSEQDLRALY